MTEIIAKIPYAAVVFLAFACVSLLLDFIIRKIRNRFDADTGEIFRLISNSQRGLLLFIGLMVSVASLGFDLSTLVASLGLTGFALGFALKDALSNLLSGIMVGLYKPFRIGDTIEIVATKGEVVDINLRYITIKAELGNCLIPNSLVIKNKLLLLKVRE